MWLILVGIIIFLAQGIIGVGWLWKVAGSIKPKQVFLYFVLAMVGVCFQAIFSFVLWLWLFSPQLNAMIH